MTENGVTKTRTDDTATAGSPDGGAVLLEQRGRVLIITINRPHARNAIDRAVSHGLADAVRRLDDDPGISVGVVTGGGGNFCAGMDLKAFLAGEDIEVPGSGLGFTEAPPRKPLIAAVEGFALAGGTELALACDLIVAATGAKFGVPEVKRGLVAGGGALLRLPKRIPYSFALELILTGESFSAQDAHRYGLVNRVAEDGGALDAAVTLADRIAVNGPLAVAASKQIVVASSEWPSEKVAFDEQRAIMNPVFSSRDAIEGASAFAEKRAPVWEGR